MKYQQAIAAITLGCFISSCSINVEQADGSMKQVWPRAKDRNTHASANKQRQKALDDHADQVVLAKLQEFDRLRAEGRTVKNTDSGKTTRDFEALMARYENANPLAELVRDSYANPQKAKLPRGRDLTSTPNVSANSDVARFDATILAPIRECKNDHAKWYRVYPALADQVRFMGREYKISVINQMVKANVPFLSGSMGEITQKTFTQADFDKYQERLEGLRIKDSIQAAILIGALGIAGKMIGGTVQNIADGFRNMNSSTSATATNSSSTTGSSRTGESQRFAAAFAGRYHDFTCVRDNNPGKGNMSPWLTLRASNGKEWAIQYSVPMIFSGNKGNTGGLATDDRQNLEGVTMNVLFNAAGEPVSIKNKSNGNHCEVKDWKVTGYGW